MPRHNGETIIKAVRLAAAACVPIFDIAKLASVVQVRVEDRSLLLQSISQINTLLLKVLEYGCVKNAQTYLDLHAG